MFKKKSKWKYFVQEEGFNSQLMAWSQRQHCNDPLYGTNRQHNTHKANNDILKHESLHKHKEAVYDQEMS